MKKVLMMLAAAAFIGFGAVSCDEKDPLPPVIDETCDVCGKNPCECENPQPTGELNVTVPVEIMLEGAGQVVASMPGEQILEYFGMTASEFYAAMGTYEGNSADGTTTQTGNIIQFGLAEGNDKDNLVFTPSTCNNFGHWVNEDAGITYWNGQSEKGNFYACAESTISWGDEAPTEETLASMWDFTVISWAENGNFTVPAAGDKFSFTEVFYQVDENDEEKLAYVTWEITFTAFEARQINTIGTVEHSMDVTYDVAYTPNPVAADYAAIAATLGVSDVFAECDIYPVAADGTYASIAAPSAWFGVDGNVSGWGSEAVMCLELGKNTLNMFCMPYDAATQTAADKCGTFTSRMAFVASNDNAVILAVTANVTEGEAVTINVLETVEKTVDVTYNDTYTPMLVTDIDYAALATTLGVANIFTDTVMYPVAQDGTFSEFPSTDNWFGADGTIAGWGANAIFDIKYEAPAADDANPFYGLKIFCMPPTVNDEVQQTAADKCGTFKGSVGFLKDNGDAVVIALTLNIAE